MGTTRASQKALQVKKDNIWQYVFASSENMGVLTTKERRKALHPMGDEKRLMDYFKNKYGDADFRFEMGKTRRSK